MRRSKYVVMTMVCWLALGGTAQANIVLGKSPHIHGVKLGMNRHQVARILGKGKAGRHYKYSSNVIYRHGLYVVTFGLGINRTGRVQTGRAIAVWTKDRHEKFQGLGVGTKFSVFARRFPNVRCTPTGTPRHPTGGYCTLYGIGGDLEFVFSHRNRVTAMVMV